MDRAGFFKGGLVAAIGLLPAKLIDPEPAVAEPLDDGELRHVHIGEKYEPIPPADPIVIGQDKDGGLLFTGSGGNSATMEVTGNAGELLLVVDERGVYARAGVKGKP